jgi:hypothetical protein
LVAGAGFPAIGVWGRSSSCRKGGQMSGTGTFYDWLMALLMLPFMVRIAFLTEEIIYEFWWQFKYEEVY